MNNSHGHTNVDDDATAEFAKVASQTKLIGICLMMGCVGFVCILFLVKGVSSEIYEGASVISWMAVCMGSMMFVTSMILPNVVVNAQLGKGHTVSSLCGLFKTKTIIGMAMSEGAAVFNGVAYMLDGQLMNLAVLSLLVVQLATRIPSVHAVENWVSDKQRAIDM